MPGLNGKITNFFQPQASQPDSDVIRQCKVKHKHVGQTWMEAVLLGVMDKPYYIKLKAFLQKEYEKNTIFPPTDLIYSWTMYCDFYSVKVVIIGQDPYHNDGQAMGLAFSVPSDHRPVPPSLLNIYKELAVDIEGFHAPSHGDLRGWARQGVLLLNTCLTVRAHQPASHAGQGWEQVTDAVIKGLSNRQGAPLVFMLWGGHAQKKALGTIDSKRHKLLKCAHPSPLSAARGFFGCRHFSQCNAFLESNGQTPIDWSEL